MRLSYVVMVDIIVVMVDMGMLNADWCVVMGVLNISWQIANMLPPVTEKVTVFCL